MSPASLFGYVLTDPWAEPVPAHVRLRGSQIEAVVPQPTLPVSSELPFITAGLIDAHVHPFETGLQFLFSDCRGADSLTEVLELLRDKLQIGRDCGVLMGFNVDPERLAERRLPNYQELDQVTDGIPTIVHRIDCHSATLNSAALQSLPQPWPEGVEFSANAVPSGVISGCAYELASRSFKRRLPPDIVHTAFSLTSDIALASGVTTMGALVGIPELLLHEWRLLLDSLTAMTVRAVPYLQAWDARLAADFGLAQVGGCLLIDGSFGSRTAALTAPYSDAATSGICYHKDDEIVTLIRQANALGMRTALHAIGDRAIEQVVRCHEIAGTHLTGLSHRIEHAELLSGQLIERIRRQNLTLCVQPAFEALWGGPNGLYAIRLGDRWRRTNPLRDLLHNGIPICGGSDSPITSIDPLAGIHAAVNMPNPTQRLEPSSAFALFTVWAAASLGLGDKVGAIKPGYDADLVLFTDDPRSNRTAKVIATLKSGRPVYHNPRSGRNGVLEAQVLRP